MTNLTVNYSGVVVDTSEPDSKHTGQPTASLTLPWRSLGGNWIYQTFTLEDHYQRGTDVAEVATPDLSGLQVCVDVDTDLAATASLEFTLQWQSPTGWETLTSGTVEGVHTDGQHIWFDILLVDSIPTTPAMLDGFLRFGIALPDGGSTTGTQVGVNSVWYQAPSPFPFKTGIQGQAFQSDGVTPLLGAGTTAALSFRILGLVADSGTSIFGNEYRSSVIQTVGGNVSTTQGLTPTPGSGAANYWMSPPLPSRFAVQNLYFDVRDQEEPVVIDSILVDPITPNMAFNVYYSQDDSTTNTQMSEGDWETKLWSRVPQAYTCTQRQQYVFPTPIQAKYIQIEFTNLQAQTYTPGPFQLPVTYKKFPTWVANFFINLMELPSFVVSQVNVQYDALSFAYDYYLDDLDQTPTTPTLPPATMANQLNLYFNDLSGIDPTTLAQIDLRMNKFTHPAGQNVDNNSALGSYVTALNSNIALPQVVEFNNLPVPAYPTVSSLNRESVIFEQSLPVMYFFLTCRHGYKELTANFDYNRAYFAGVNEVAFLRNDYSVVDDTPIYIETGGDTQNISVDDFVNIDNVWLTY